MHGKRPLSPSALRRFEQCPLQFWFQDIERCQGRSELTLPVSVGNLVHATLAAFFRLPAPKRSVKAAQALLRQRWRHYCPRNLFASREEEAFYGRRCIDWLRRYVEASDLTVQPAALEVGLNATLPGGTRICGRVDRIDRRPGCDFRVIDYKTGERWLDEDDLCREPAAQIYLLLASQQFGPVESVRFVYLATGEELVWAPEQEDLPHIAEAVAAYVDGIWTQPHYDARPGPHCVRCPFALACPALGTTGPAGRTGLAATGDGDA